jgi:hypothetical protein
MMFPAMFMLQQVATSSGRCLGSLVGSRMRPSLVISSLPKRFCSSKSMDALKADYKVIFQVIEHLEFFSPGKNRPVLWPRPIGLKLIIILAFSS